MLYIERIQTATPTGADADVNAVLVPSSDRSGTAAPFRGTDVSGAC